MKIKLWQWGAPVRTEARSTTSFHFCLNGAVIAASMLAASFAHADVQQFRQDENNYSGASDTYIVKRYPNTNFGSDVVVKALGVNTLGLLKWDIKSIPSNARINDVNITLKVSNASKERFNVYAMTKPWQGNTATWSALQPNLQGRPILGTLQANSTGSYSIVLNPDGKNVVQSWVQGSPNYGFVIASGGAGLDNIAFASRDARTISTHPKLEISYSLDTITTPVPTVLPTLVPVPTATATPKPTQKPTATPTPVALATYAAKCSACHGSLTSSNVSGSDASWIKDAIVNNRGGMGYLSSLTNADLNSIASELGGAADLAVATPVPTLAPTLKPTVAPTLAPTLKPTVAPTLVPTLKPTVAPTLAPTLKPTSTPTPTIKPTAIPTPTPKLATYSASCSSCHGSLSYSNVSGSNASWIKDAIDYNRGGMGYLSNLSNADLNSIATELGGAADLAVSTPVPTTPPTVLPTLAPTVKPTLAPTLAPTSRPTSTPTPIQKLATYAGKCASCHGSLSYSNVSGSNASWIKDAIDYNRGGMGYLSNLTNADLNSIATELGGAADLAVATPTPVPGGGTTPTATPKPTPVTPTPVPTSGAKNVIDVMVLYTTQHQTAAAAKQRLNFLVTLANQAYKDSFIDLQIRLVHTEPTTYSDSTDFNTALDDLTNGSGVFASVAATRAKYGADLVDLFRPYQGGGTCGLAWLGTGFLSGGGGSKNEGFSVVGDGSDPSGSGNYCDDVTFHHELGHNMGLDHERENSSGGMTEFPYGFAWGVNGTFGTVMGYDSPTLNYFSTPLLPTQCKGQPCGYPKEDSRRGSDQTAVVNITAPSVANYMPTTTDTPVLQ